MLSRLALTLDEDLNRIISIHHLFKPSIKAYYIEMFPIWLDPNWMAQSEVSL